MIGEDLNVFLEICYILLVDIVFDVSFIFTVDG